MKTVLCYGDSNTWGYDPATQERFARDERWTGVLRQELGESYHVIEEGCNGRTTVWDDPKKRLAKAGFPLMEMYPGGAQDVWGIPRARRDRAGLRSGLVRLGVKGLAAGATPDELDAVTGALVGRQFLLGRARVLGDDRTGAILLPRARATSSA